MRRNADEQGSEGEGCPTEQGKTKMYLCDAFFCACVSDLWILAWKGDCFMK